MRNVAVSSDYAKAVLIAESRLATAGIDDTLAPGETDGFSVSDHIRAIDSACGCYLFDAVLVQKMMPSDAVITHYARAGVGPVLLDRAAILDSGRRIIAANVMEERENLTVRHHSERLARVLLRWYSRTQRLW